MDTVTMPADLAMALRRYLGLRPYDEVAQLVQAMHTQIKPAEAGVE